jgi:hypothetical protein
VRRGPGTPSRWRPALLSALVFPGAGQLSRHRYGPALAFGGTTLALLAVVVRRVVVETQARLPTDPDELLSRLLGEPGWPLRLAAEIQRDNAALFFWLTLALVAVWALSVWDAWREAPGRKP